jgi:hypothetical protein
MTQPLTADDILPLVKRLSLHERRRLVRLMSASPAEDAAVYRAVPPGPDEFSNETDLLAVDADGWENVG